MGPAGPCGPCGPVGPIGPPAPAAPRGALRPRQSLWPRKSLRAGKTSRALDSLDPLSARSASRSLGVRWPPASPLGALSSCDRHDSPAREAGPRIVTRVRGAQGRIRTAIKRHHIVAVVSHRVVPRSEKDEDLRLPDPPARLPPARRGHQRRRPEHLQALTALRA